MMDRLAIFPVSPILPQISGETASAATHGVGCVLSVVGGIALVRSALAAGDPLQTLGCAVYASSAVALYGASTLSHSYGDPQRKSLFRMLDQVFIFVMIAGSFTPFAMTHMRTVLGWTLLALMWMLTLVGVITRIRLGRRPMEFVWYLPLAWLPVLTLGHVLMVTGLTGFIYVIAGGLAYMVGLWFYVNDHRHRYFHAVWHCWVIMGSGLHFLFHFQCVTM